MDNNIITDPCVYDISKRVVQAAKDTFMDKLDKVYLYGSYARGDYDYESDINFMIIVDTSQEEACAKHTEVRSHMPGIDLEFDILVSCCVTSSEVFNQYVNDLPFYSNVVREGIVVND
ncbi:MAG: nucleotidyltransferase domain-containing protein [Oscillospiraceae bacterium]|nr:nucleotidyltransferase domain-containing protein [Oscillospiraceae bacterium]